MNTQQLFNKIANHLLDQNARAGTVDNCRYHDSKTGNKCAVGCLISPQYYDPKIEGNNTNAGVVQRAVEQSVGRELTLGELDLLIVMQNVHDQLDPDLWAEEINQAAKEFNLTFERFIPPSNTQP